MSSAGSSATPSTEPEKKAGKKPAKRARTKKNDDVSTPKAPVKRRGRQGRLSVLPTLPMDLLYEIFAHLGPADLLNLARTTKSFRNILMSRQSAFIWRSVLDAASEEDGHPPRPEDMDEPAWTNLVFGGAKCGLCGGKTSKEILWAIRKRLCKACQNAHLVRAYSLTRPETMDPKTSWIDVIPSDASRHLERLLLVNNSDRISFNVLLQDTRAYEDELEALLTAEGDFNTLRAQLDEEKKTKMVARYAHAKACYAAEDARSENREVELGDLKKTRFDQIKSRLLEMGYDSVDIENREFKRHTEVRQPKPVTDKIWTRLGPIVSEVVKEIRDRRLVRQRDLRMDKRQDVVEELYNDHIMRKLPWSMVSLVPHLRRVWQRPGLEGVKTILEEEDTEPTGAYRRIMHMELLASIPGIQQSILSSAESLRTAVPQSWTTVDPTTPSAPLCHEFVDSNDTLDLSPLASLDRAACVFRCQDSKPGGKTRPIHFGLDGIAHGCARRAETPVEPEDDLRLLVIQILGLLGLDPTTATPLDIDKLAPVVVCMHAEHAHHSTLNAGTTRGVAFTNWRDAVAHGDTRRLPPDHKTGSPVYRIASDMEARFVRAAIAIRSRDKPSYGGKNVGCCHCTEHLKFRQVGYYRSLLHHQQNWTTLQAAKDHLRTAHEIDNGVEGVDYYYDRRNPVARFEHKMYEEASRFGMTRYHTGPIRVPDLPAAQLETQVLAKEATVASFTTVA